MRTATVAPSYCVSGTLVRIREDGRALVDFPGNRAGPLEARLAFSGAPPAPPAAEAPVLLAFEGGDLSLPLIIGFVCDRFPPEAPARVINSDRSRPNELNVDVRQIRLAASDQVVLQCGRASISLTADGTIQIKGARIVSRSSGTHKICGATVRIN